MLVSSGMIGTFDLRLNCHRTETIDESSYSWILPLVPFACAELPFLFTSTVGEVQIQSPTLIKVYSAFGLSLFSLRSVHLLI